MITNILNNASRRLTLNDCRSLILAEIVVVVLLMHVNNASLTGIPLFFGPTNVNINVPKIAGDLFGTFLKAKKDIGEPLLQHALGPLLLNVNVHWQPYQYTPENYQYVPPPAPSHIQGGYYPHGLPNYYTPTSGNYGPGYYPAVSMSPWYHNQPNNLPNHDESYLNWPIHSTEPSQIYTNPYMRPTNPPRANLRPIYDKLNIPPNVPLRESPKTPYPRRPLKPGTIITPDSPLYVHIAEEPTTLDIDPRR